MKKIFTSTLLVCLFTSFLIAQNHNASQAYLGIHHNTVSKKKAKKLNFEEPNGSYVTNVIANTAAEKIGLQPFDYIYQIDDYKINSHHNNLNAAMNNFQPEDDATIYFVRKGEKMSKAVTFGKRSDGKTRQRTDEEDPFLGIHQSHDKIPSTVVGIPVNIQKNSTAENLKLQDGDIITYINDYPIYDWHDAGTAIDMMEVGEEIKVTYLRSDKITEVSGPIQSLAGTKNRHQEKEEISIEEETPIAMENLAIEMEDMPEEEAEEMKNELGIDMPIVQNLSIEQLRIFPNPSQGLFNLQFNLPNNAPTQIRIFDGTGRMVYSNDLGNFEGDFSERLDLTNNPAGTYYLMVQQGKLSISKKVIIARP